MSRVSVKAGPVRQMAAYMDEITTRSARQRARSAAHRAAMRGTAIASGVVVPTLRGTVPYASTSSFQGTRNLYANAAKEVNYFDQKIIEAQPLKLFSDGTLAFSEPATAFNGITCLNEVNQGSAAYNRIGNKIVMRSISVSGQFTATVPTIQAMARILVVYDRQTNGTAPVLADILYSDPAGSTEFTSGVNMRNKSRFLVIRDFYLPFDTGQALGHTFKLFAKGRWESEFKANTGPPSVIGDIATGALYLIAFIGTQGAAGTVTLRNCVSRIRFYA